jgi:hypothetical protein
MGSDAWEPGRSVLPHHSWWLISYSMIFPRYQYFREPLQAVHLLFPSSMVPAPLQKEQGTGPPVGLGATTTCPVPSQTEHLNFSPFRVPLPLQVAHFTVNRLGIYPSFIPPLTYDMARVNGSRLIRCSIYTASTLSVITLLKASITAGSN